MGDKGGKKDKEKQRQQHVTKQKQEEQKKQDKAHPKTAPLIGEAKRVGAATSSGR
jgi:hypothetical protein